MNPTFRIDLQVAEKPYTFTIEVFPEKAPLTVANFCDYVKRGHYVDTVFHRLVQGFALQGGGYTAALEKKPTLDPIKNEANNGLSNRKYTVAMARREEKDSATTQFYINLNDNDNLDHVSEEEFGYCVFGKVIAGFETIEAIELLATHTVKGYKNVPVPLPVFKNIVDITKR
ncbi:MAG: peptidylprolyl isomerase [Chlamydiales bacterium]|nr:peptidylprolyl isomerase [Chlamydiales bacterium]